MKTLDCRAHKCPHPVVETRKLLLAEPGLPITVLVGDETARENVTRLAGGQGYEVRSEPTEGGFALTLTPTEAGTTAQAAAAAEGPTVVFVGAETMGRGDDELGRLLLKNFLITLLEFDRVPDALLFVNGGVRLACAGSEVLEPLNQLACRGTDVAACGLCLDFFGIKDQLAVGRVTNMFDIADTLGRAGRVIRP
jgi:selenium metabolism protein YedF